jgi:polyisoprenoid-binding protein YceI
MTAEARALVAAVISLLPGTVRGQGGERDSVTYVLSAASRFEVKTGKAGLFGFAGHAHLVRARAVAGRVIYYPNMPATSRVEIVVSAESLEVVTPPDTAEIRKVTRAMRTDVLHVDEYPSISFVSTAATPSTEGFQLQGRLTLVGQSRDVTLDVHTDVGADTLRASGSFAVKQTDFGIRPYRGGPAGTVRVADRVTISVDAVGIRAPDP